MLLKRWAARARVPRMAPEVPATNSWEVRANPMDLKQYWRISWKHRWWVAAATLMVVIAIGTYAFATAPEYRATCKLLLEAKSKAYTDINPARDQGKEFQSISATVNPVDTQIELLKSDFIVAKVIAHLDLRDDQGRAMTPPRFLERGKATNLKGTDMVQIAYEDTDPRRAQKVANAWAEIFVKENLASNTKEARQAVRLMTGQLEKTKGELERAELALRDYKLSHRAIDLSEQARSSIATVTSVETELRQTDAAYRAAQTRAGGLRRQLGLNASQALAASALSQDPSVIRLRQQLLEAETNPVLANTALGAQHPDVRSAHAQVETLRRKLTIHASRVLGHRIGSGAVQQSLDPIRQDLTRDLVQAEIEALSYQTRVQALRALTAGYNRRLDLLPNQELQLTRLTRNAAVSAETYKMLLSKLEEARFKESISVGNVRIVDLALLPELPIRPQKAFLLAAALAVGLVLGLGIALFLEYLDDTIQTAEDAEAALTLPVLAVVPWMRKTKNAGLVTQQAPRSAFAEAYRTLRTNIRFLAGNDLKTLVVTSAGPGEGKSTTVVNLAFVFSQSGRRVLLVDADMRRPTIHAAFKLPNERGLSTILAGEHALDALVREGPNEKVHVLTSGPPPVDPAELLESPAMEAFLAQAKAKYDLVIFDAPPVIAVMDACVLGARADGVMLLLGLNKVTHKAARHAFKLLQAANVRIFGMVLRGVRPENDPYYYNYYHSYTASPPPSPLKRASQS